MPVRKPIALALLLVGLILSGPTACSDDAITDPPPAPGPTGIVRIDVTPDGDPITWSVTDADSTTYTGSGDSVLTAVAVGDCEVLWPDLEGYYPPYPPCETLALAENDTVTFSISYFAQPVEPTKILFLGSSYFGSNALVELFAGLAAAKGKEIVIGGHYPSGQFLDYHTTSSSTANLIRSREWDYVILQGVGRITAYPADAHFNLEWAIRAIEQQVHQFSSEAKVMYQMPWAFEDGMLWTPGGTDDYFAMQQLVYDNTLELAEELDIVIAPVGWAWNAVMLEEPPLHYLFMSDWNHPSLRGSYLMACVFFSSVFLEPISGATYCGNVPAVEALHFQDIASDMVLDGLDLWHLSGTGD